MFEHMTFESILAEMLDAVSADVDKREGSIIYDALAPTALKLAETYSDMDVLMLRTFAETADGDDLDKRVGEAGVKRKKASYAIRKGVFTAKDEPFVIPIGAKFILDNITYSSIQQITPGTYQLRAETAGTIGNRAYGELVPTEPIEGLGLGMLTDVLIPGEDVETDEALFAKYLEHIREKAFGGNRADYKKRILEIQGVGGVRLFRAPGGGGTVGAEIISSEYAVPTPELIDLVQTSIDPIPYTGEGYGTAPIGHEVLVEGVLSTSINYSATLLLSGVSLGQVEPQVKAIIEGYLSELRKQWAGSKTPLVVRLVQIEARLLQIEGVQDVLSSELNGLSQNVSLPEEVPALGDVTLSE